MSVTSENGRRATNAIWCIYRECKIDCIQGVALDLPDCASNCTEDNSRGLPRGCVHSGSIGGPWKIPESDMRTGCQVHRSGAIRGRRQVKEMPVLSGTRNDVYRVLIEVRDAAAGSWANATSIVQGFCAPRAISSSSMDLIVGVVPENHMKIVLNGDHERIIYGPPNSGDTPRVVAIAMAMPIMP